MKGGDRMGGAERVLAALQGHYDAIVALTD